MVQFYTLQEAAAKLQLTPDKLKEMVKKNEIRAFMDRGTLRFRSQEVDELARTRGIDSDPELKFSDAEVKSSEPKSSPPAGPKTPRATKHIPAPTDEDFDIGAGGDDEEVSLGHDPSSSASASKNTPRNTNTRSPKPKHARGGDASPAPARPGSDSDVRLVGEGSGLNFAVEDEPKILFSPAPAPKTPPSGRKAKVEAAPDSGVRIVPLDDASDSDVKIVPDDDPDSKVALGQSKSKTPSDSDIRLEELHTDSGKKKRDDKNLVTEEIDLDAEEVKAAKAAQKKKPTKTKPREGSSQLPTDSPFELSDPDVNLGSKAGAKGSSKADPKKKSRVEKKKKDDDEDSSSDFDLTPAKDTGSSPLELGSDEMPRLTSDSEDEVNIGGELTGPGGGTSGINLKDPMDSGISLEEGGSDEIELELPVNQSGPASASPKSKKKLDSSSEFELSIDDSDSPEEEGSSSEFELTLDEPSSPVEEGSSSEFELSLDLDESSSAEVKNTDDKNSDSEFELTIDDGAGFEDSAALEEEDKDIFETDFEVPALEEESGSEAVALDEVEGEADDSESDSSDFDLDVDEVDEESDTEAESGSEVVALDEEGDEEAEPAPKKKKGSRTAVAEEEELEPSDFEDLESADDTAAAEEAEAEAEAEEEAAASPARRSWGVFAPVCMLLCAPIMIVVCLMSFELLNGMFGYHKSTRTSNLIVDPLARMVYGDDAFPKE